MLRRAAWLSLSAAVAWVCLVAAPARADVTVIGDRSAYDEVLSAFKKLFSLSGFRATSTDSQGQVRGLFEYAAPNSWHFATQGGTYETIRVDGRAATRVNLPGQPAGWRCGSGTAKADRPLFDPNTAAGTYNLSRGPDTIIDGAPVHTIIWNDGAKRITYYIGIQNGLPKRAATDKDTLDYYDYGAHVAITLPECAQ